jgi:hypothetical protein
LSHKVPVITSTGSFWDDEDTGDGFIFVGHREYDLYNGIAQVIQTHAPEILNKRRLDLQKLLEGLTLERQAEVLVKQLVGHPYREQKPKVNISPIWDYRNFGGSRRNRNFGGSRRISPRRATKIMYYGAVNNFYAHRFLVLIGMRRFVRFLRKIR